jgi:hypothetical protein
MSCVGSRSPSRLKKVRALCALSLSLFSSLLFSSLLFPPPTFQKIDSRSRNYLVHFSRGYPRERRGAFFQTADSKGGTRY